MPRLFVEGRSWSYNFQYQKHDRAERGWGGEWVERERGGKGREGGENTNNLGRVVKVDTASKL